jgi:hypothetical protein
VKNEVKNSIFIKIKTITLETRFQLALYAGHSFLFLILWPFINRSFPFVEVKGVFGRLNRSHGRGLDWPVREQVRMKKSVTRK